MANIVRWFEDFPNRALTLLRDMEPLATASDLTGSLSLLIAPALITAPYERLQTYARRRNPQADYLRFPDAHRRFDEVMCAPFGEAPFWTQEARNTVYQWRSSRVTGGIGKPRHWQTADGHRPWGSGFWSSDILSWETREAWKYLRDSLAHWNVVTCDRDYRMFDEGGTMERLLLYRSDRDAGPWDVISVTPDAFLCFLKCWADFLSSGLAYDVLVATAAE